MSETAEHETAASPGFADLGLGERILKSLKAVGYESPSAIQAQTIP